MTSNDVAAALHRAESVLQRRPNMALRDDAPATARWDGGLRMVASHANGTQVLTDMPGELGGTGDQVTAGWLLRAGLSTCAATSIAMAAARAGIELRALEVRCSSRSDTRGVLGMADIDGDQVPAGPRDVELLVRIAAAGVAPDRLRAVVDAGYRCSPVPCAVQEAVPVALNIEIDGE